MKIYISGKIAGDPDYKGKFARAAAQLERLGATVINPALAPEGLTKLDYMRICFAEMEAADYAVFLPDWVESPGARLERAWCEYVGLPAEGWDAFLAARVGKSKAGYTYRQLLQREHPEYVGSRQEFVGGCMGCPSTYGYAPENSACLGTGGIVENQCAACWDRMVPGSGAV